MFIETQGQQVSWWISFLQVYGLWRSEPPTHGRGVYQTGPVGSGIFLEKYVFTSEQNSMWLIIEVSLPFFPRSLSTHGCCTEKEILLLLQDADLESFANARMSQLVARKSMTAIRKDNYCRHAFFYYFWCVSSFQARVANCDCRSRKKFFPRGEEYFIKIVPTQMNTYTFDGCLTWLRSS